MVSISNEGAPVMDVLPKQPIRKPRARVVVEETPITLPPSFTAPPPRDNALQNELSEPRRKRWPYIIAALVVLALIVVAGSSYFGKMHITVTRKTSTVTPASVITFTVPFTPVQLEDEVSAQSSTKTDASPDTKATGSILITNASQTTKQELVARTRFQSANGNIYRTSEKVIVPAAKKSGTTITPGTVKATIVADGVGEKYNIPNGTPLTIVGFVGTARAKIFSGVTQTAIVGGADKPTRIVHPNDVNPVFTSLETELKTMLANRLGEDKSSIILLPKDPYTIASTSVSPDFGAPAESFEARVKGGVSAISVNPSDLSTAIAQALFEGFPADMNSLRVDSPEALIVTDTNASTRTATIRVQGDLALTWLPNENRLKEDLQGKRTADIESIFKRFEAIASAEASFTPAWWPKIPATDRISITYR